MLRINISFKWRNVTLDHKTSNKGQFLEIEIMHQLKA